MMIKTLALLLALSAPLAVRAADLEMRIDARDVAKKRLHTALALAVKPGPLVLVYPKWIPGEHAASGPIDSMIGLEIRANGVLLPWTRDPSDFYRFRVTVPDGVAKLDIAIESGLPTSTGGFSAGPTSSENLAILHFNQFMLIPLGIDSETASATMTLLPPADWTLVSALDTKVVAGSGYVFEPTTIGRLIDSPTQIGRYAKRVSLPGSAPRPDIAHSISFFADSEGALAVPDSFTAAMGRLVAEQGAFYGTRKYRHYTWLVSLSDPVAHFGIEHNESSDNRNLEGALLTEEGRRGLGVLLSHEYFHSWNGKYRRPIGEINPDYAKPYDTSLMWVYEGMTWFGGEVMAARAGLIPPDWYRELVAFSATTYDNQPGTAWRPLADVATSAPYDYSSPSAFQSSRRWAGDFYQASTFLWLDVDAEIRDLSKGKASIDDYARRFYAGTPGSPAIKAYDEDELYATLNAVVPNDWRGFIRRHLDQTGTKALFGGLEHSGWKLVYTDIPNAAVAFFEKRGRYFQRTASIGLTFLPDGTIIDAVEDHEAARAGAGPGMKIIGVNATKFTPDLLDAAITAAKASRKPIELLIENGDRYRTLSVPYYGGQRFPHLARIESRPDALSALIAPHVMK